MEKFQNVDKFQEECGVFGIFSKGNVDSVFLTYYGLYALQHRGQESAGIVVSDKNKLKCYKNMGLVSHVFNKKILNNLKGNSAIGHVRYSTTGDSNLVNAQPILENYLNNHIALAHNGNLINADSIKNMLEKKGLDFKTTTDSEVIVKLIEFYINKGIEKAILEAVHSIKGSYGLTILTLDKLIGIRDPNGIRPLCLGKLNDSYIICSESCALNALGAELIRDIAPGEMVIIDESGIKSIKFSNKNICATCSFEYIYFSREDSIINNIEIYSWREFAGGQLYKEHPVQADIVIGVPDSGIPAAIGYSKASNIPYTVGLTKNKYVGRTFILPNENLREESVSVKLNPIKANLEGKKVIVIDDSIVRGTTSKNIVEALRRGGAKEVHFISASPIVKHGCNFGINTFNEEGLIGSFMNICEIREFIGADSVAYLSVDGLKKVFGNREEFCLGCFNGNYPVHNSEKKDERMLYLITNRKLIKNSDLCSVIENAVLGGVDSIILREKDLDEDDLLNVALKIKKSISSKGAKLIVNGNLNVAKKVHAWGLQLSFNEFMKKNHKFNGAVGVSVHSLDEAMLAEKNGANYILASHVFKTDCKKGLEPRGVKFIEDIRKKVKIPLIALGGINEKNEKEVFKVGADGVAVMSYIMASDNPYAASKTLKEQALL